MKSKILIFKGKKTKMKQ